MEPKRAKVFWSGRSQAVRLPKEFRFRTDTVIIRREGDALILEPADEWPEGYVESFAGGVPESKGTRVSIETDREATNTTVSIQNLVPHRPESSKRDYRRLLADQI